MDICKNGSQNRSNDAVFVVTYTILEHLNDVLAHVDATDLLNYGESLSRSIAKALQPFGFDRGKVQSTEAGAILDPVHVKAAGRPAAKRMRAVAEPKTGTKDTHKCGLCGEMGHNVDTKCSLRRTFGHQITAPDWSRKPDLLPGLEDLWMGH